MHFNLGINYLLCQKSQQAEEKFDHAIECADEPEYHNYKGLALYMSGEYHQCLPIFEYALKLYNDKNIRNKEVAECWYNMGNTYLKLANHT